MPSPVLCRVPRTLAKRHGAPRCSARQSALASKPPQARTTAPAPMRLRSPRCSTSTPAMPSRWRTRPTARVSWMTRIFALQAARRSASTRPGPPRAACSVSPPQNRWRPSSPTNDWLPQSGTKRTPWPAIQRRVARLSPTRVFASIGIAAAAAGRVEIGQVLRLGVGAEVGAGAILGGQLRRHSHQVADAVVGESHRRHGEAAVAAVLALGGALEHGDASAALARRERRAQRRVAGAYDDDVVALVRDLGLACRLRVEAC